MVTKEEVKKIASLARLDLTDEEIVKMQKDLSEVLDYFNMLKEIKQSDIQDDRIGRDLRKDEAMPQEDSVVKALLDQAPEKKGSHLKVKEIFNGAK